jgi:hypothetical protein
VFSAGEYCISSVDGNTHKITLFVKKLWDLIVLKLTEVVHYDTIANKFDWYKKSDWYEYADEDENWYIFFSIKTIAECLNSSTDADSLAHLYDRIVAAAATLQNIRLDITNWLGGYCCQIDGYLNYVGVRDNSDIDDSIMKSNALFVFYINPELIAHLATQRIPLYYFDHAWLHFTGQSQNAYAAAKRIGRHYSQNSHNCKSKIAKNMGVSMKISTLKEHLPCLSSKSKKDNRVTLDKAINAIPGVIYNYTVGNKGLTFEELIKLRLRQNKYEEVKVTVRLAKHPNTSENKVTSELIKNMDCKDFHPDHRPLYSLEAADKLINRQGALKKLVKQCDPISGGDVLQDTEAIAAEEGTTTENVVTD